MWYVFVFFPPTIYHAINSKHLPCSHSMTSPPLCFRVEAVCSGWCAPDKFQHTDSPTFSGLTCLDSCYALHIYRWWQRSVRYSKLKILIYWTAVYTGRLFINQLTSQHIFSDSYLLKRLAELDQMQCWALIAKLIFPIVVLLTFKTFGSFSFPWMYFFW